MNKYTSSVNGGAEIAIDTIAIRPQVRTVDTADSISGIAAEGAQFRSFSAPTQKSQPQIQNFAGTAQPAADRDFSGTNNQEENVD